MENMKNICVSSQLDDFLLSSAPGIDTQSGIMGAGAGYGRRNSRLSNNMPNFHHGRWESGASIMRLNSNRSGRGSIRARKQAIADQANQRQQNAAYHQNFTGPPKYFNDEFKAFLKANNAWENEGTGYMFIRLDKEDSFYRTGETVKGTVFFELFHQSA